MRYGISLLALLCALSVGTAQVDAQGRGKGQANRPTSAGAKQGGAKADRQMPATAKGPKSTSSPKATGNGTKKAAPVTGTEARVKGNPHKTTTPTTAPTTSVTPETPTATYVKNPRLENRLRALLNLPEGTPIGPLSAGFKNWGQFVAAVHVSNNLGIDFTQLKTAMTGLVPGATPTDPWVPSPTPTTQMSLGQAIQSLPGTTTPEGETLTTSSVQTQVKKAEDAATADLRRTRGGN